MKIFPYEKVFTEPQLLGVEIHYLKNNGFSVIEFSTHLRDKKDIFEFVKKEFPLDPLLGEGNSWDALSDSIGGGIEQFRNTGVVVLVKNTLREREEPSAATIEFIDILFHIKEYQLFENMKIYLFLSPPPK